MRAMMIWDGGGTVHVPPSMGDPCDDQLTGTVGEQVIEVACRLCYDSLGLDAEGKRKGRDTASTLGVILKHRHHSVLEHFTRTIRLTTTRLTSHQELMLTYALLNRRGVWTRRGNQSLHVTMNARALVEWDTWSARLCRSHGAAPRGELGSIMWTLGIQLKSLFAGELPILVPQPTDAGFHTDWAILHLAPRFVEPEQDHERFVTLYLRGSRGFSHEQVRHRFGVSQRSTRFTDESESPWDLHPLLEQFMEEQTSGNMLTDLNKFIDDSRGLYDDIVAVLQESLEDKLKVERGTTKLKLQDRKLCRKQARGAARGVLGNALRTDMAFTASVADWRHVMLPQRASDAADAEIRRVFVGSVDDPSCVLKALLESRYGDRFEDLQDAVVMSKDGTSYAANLVNLD